MEGGSRTGRSLNILSSSSSLCHAPKNLSNQHIFAYSTMREERRSKAHEAILKGRRTLIYFLALPHHRRPRMEWDQEHAYMCARVYTVDLLRHVEKTRIARVTPSFRSRSTCQPHPSFREFIPLHKVSASRPLLPVSPFILLGAKV